MVSVAVLSGILGTLIGSFLNVVIAREPVGESVVSPPSRCPGCQQPIAARDNVPVAGWLMLKGRARCCDIAISRRYPLVEAFTGLAFGFVTWWLSIRASELEWVLGGTGLFSPSGVITWLTLLYLVAVSVVLALIDLDVKRLPWKIVLQAWAVVGLGLGAAALLAGERTPILRMLLGALALWLLYRLLHLIYPAGMAYGDVRLSALIGGASAWIGWPAFAVAAFSGFLLGGVGGALLMLRGRGGMKTQIPYGPYMLAGMWLGIFAGTSLSDKYLSLFGL